MYIDVHCHLFDKRFLGEETLVKELDGEKIDFVINTADSLSSSIETLTSAAKYGKVYAAIGVHPENAEEITDISLNILLENSKAEKCLAIGEIGLDYHYEGFNEDLQKSAFIRQIELANTAKLPVVIHSRDCTADMLKILKDNKSLLKNGFVMHCFSGSKETAAELLKLGGFISFSGTVTFKNARNLLDVASFVPSDRILTETDSPYLAPVPHRSEINRPIFVKYVAEKVAEIKGIEIGDFCAAVKKNAKSVFRKIKD